jgi:hypothetical protein
MGDSDAEGPRSRVIIGAEARGRQWIIGNDAARIEGWSAKGTCEE